MQWILNAWKEMSKELIAKYMKYCALTLKVDRNEDGEIHCFNARQPCENAADKLQSLQEVLFEPDINLYLPTTMVQRTE